MCKYDAGRRGAAGLCTWVLRRRAVALVVVGFAGSLGGSADAAGFDSVFKDAVKNIGKATAGIERAAETNSRQGVIEQSAVVSKVLEQAADAAKQVPDPKAALRASADRSLEELAATREEYANLERDYSWKVDLLRWVVFLSAAISAFVLAFMSGWGGARTCALFFTLLAAIGQGADGTFGYSKAYGLYRSAAVSLNYCYRECRASVDAKFVLVPDAGDLAKDVVAALGVCREQERKIVEQAQFEGGPVTPPKLDVGAR